jgi:hypothetical protein
MRRLSFVIAAAAAATAVDDTPDNQIAPAVLGGYPDPRAALRPGRHVFRRAGRQDPPGLAGRRTLDELAGGLAYYAVRTRRAPSPV